MTHIFIYFCLTNEYNETTWVLLKTLNKVGKQRMGWEFEYKFPAQEP